MTCAGRRASLGFAAPIAAALVAGLVALTHPRTAHAENLTGTLRKIHDDGVIVLGVRQGSVPFSYSDGQHTIGYSQAIAAEIVDELKRRLALPDLKVREVPVTAANRIPMLLNNQIDLECATTTHTAERAIQVDFSYSVFQYAVRMLVRKGSGIRDFPDLAGKTVVTTAGSSDERMLRQLNSEKQLNMRITSTRDHPQAFEALQANRAVAFVMDEPLVYALKATAMHPDDYVVTGTPLGYETYACMMRKGDEPLRALVNGVIARSQTSGDAERLYNTWFMQPIPPNGINLNYPLSAQMRALFAHPNDRALD